MKQVYNLRRVSKLRELRSDEPEFRRLLVDALSAISVLSTTAAPAPSEQFFELRLLELFPNDKYFQWRIPRPRNS